MSWAEEEQGLCVPTWSQGQAELGVGGVGLGMLQEGGNSRFQGPGAPAGKSLCP